VSKYVVRQTGSRRYVVEFKTEFCLPVMDLNGPREDRPTPRPWLPMTFEIGTARTERGARRIVERDRRARERRAHWDAHPALEVDA